MTRALITDPHLARKVAAGKPDEVLRCIGCNVCISRYHAGLPIACAQNPRTGRELRHRSATATRTPLRVVVVGAGPAGLAAAAEAGGAGHEVVVLEREDHPGGQVALAGSAPGHAELFQVLVSNYQRLLGRAGAEIRLGVEAQAEGVVALDPDAVVVATGARPYVPDLPLGGLEISSAWAILEGGRPEGGRVVVADWSGDASGLDAAEVLASEGFEVTLAVGAPALGETIHQYARNLYAARLYRAGVAILHHLELASAGPGGVVFENLFAPELETKIEADALVLALGRVPVRGLAESLAARGIDVHEAGDCLSPRSLEEAILEGTQAGARVADRALAT
jgi:NADPH-dependent 2,4-dienoyl-CoA reductase/sulfur reductase-like enzyme